MKITCSQRGFYALIFAIFINFPQIAFAQNAVPGFAEAGCHHLEAMDNDPDGLGGDFAESYVQLDGDCNFTKYITISILCDIQTLNEGALTEQGNSSFNSPEYCIPLPMFIEYTFGDSDPMYAPVNNFSFTEVLSCVGPVSTAVVPLTYNFANECRGETPGGGLPTRHDCQNLMTIPYTVKLVTPGGILPTDPYMDYPVQNYTGEGEIFSCDAFHETSGCCAVTDCGSFTLQESGTVDICCGDCGQSVITTPPTQEDTPSRAFVGKGKTFDNHRSLVFPNPFQSTINLQLSGDQQGPVSIDVLDMHGKVVQSMTPFTAAKEEQVRINTESLNRGIYYVRIRGTQGVESHKVIKL